ncbi:MAG: phosphoribosylanthranilate isomerase [Bacteroidota bacterium]
MKLKVCGLKQEHNIAELMQMQIDYMGFIFYKKSPRFAEELLSFDFVRTIPKHIKIVGVFVNESSYSIFNHVAHYNLDMVQLHGNESPELCAELKPYVKVTKTFQITDDFDFTQLANYLSVVDHFLFDSSSINYGGSGKIFNWKLLELYNYKTTFFLSGGISEDHIREIKLLNLPQLFAIDINSKFETKPGLKNTEQIKKFILNLNYYDNK